MRMLLAAGLGIHALLHLLGFLKAFSLVRAPQLKVPISRRMGALWLVAAVVLALAAVGLMVAPAWFWLPAVVGVLASQVAIVTSWADARFGTVPNVLTLLGALYASVAIGPFGLHAEYQTRAGQARPTPGPSGLVTDADLARLPAPVQRYLRYVGVVGEPHVRGIRLHFRGRIRSAPGAAWMPFVGEQRSLVAPATRLFFMQATMRGVPLDALHAYDGGAARMRVKLLSLFALVDTGGPEFTRAETVTLLNDLCIMAPAALIDVPIVWKTIDDRHVEATYSNGPHTVRGVLVFDAFGALENFWSDDRPALAADGARFAAQRWSTPVGDYRMRGTFRLASRGEARYAAALEEYAYIEFDDLDVISEFAPR
jgi:hypothetical protein